MNLILFLLRASWRTVLLAGLVGAVSGAASVGLVAAILLTLRQPETSSAAPIALFAGLCTVVLATRVGSQIFLTRLTQNTISEMRMGICRRILASPLRHLEEIGTDRMLASLTHDVAMVSIALGGLPNLAVNFVILICGAVYLGLLSPMLLAGAVVFTVLSLASYWFSAVFARRYEYRGREANDHLYRQLRCMISGVKEMKMHHDRRTAFVDQVLRPADASLRDLRCAADIYQNASIAWGRLTFFIAIGLLLFVWPRVFEVDSVTLTGYALTILYLMSPLDQIVGWLPLMAMASVSAAKTERLGLMLEEGDRESTAVKPIESWSKIELSGITHRYRREGQTHDFVLGPIDLVVRPGEIVFIVGGNGTGKTTLAKLICGLYTPEEGEIRLDGRTMGDAEREGYRQLFSVVFDDAMVFDSLMGLEHQDLDERAGEYLRQLQLDHKVKVTDGRLSTTELSRGQRKRLAMLTAYLEDRSVYLFDEWAADQDPTFKKVFYLQILPQLKQQGKAVIAVTHDDRYFSEADRLVKLEEGRVVPQFEQEPHPEAVLEKW